MLLRAASQRIAKELDNGRCSLSATTVLLARTIGTHKLRTITPWPANAASQNASPVIEVMMMEKREKVSRHDAMQYVMQLATHDSQFVLLLFWLACLLSISAIVVMSEPRALDPAEEVIACLKK